MNIIIQEKWYSIGTCEANPNMLFVFGDNEQRMGMGGQAIIRQMPNAVGLATKKSSAFYWSDDNLEHNKKVINGDIYEIKRQYEEEKYKYLVLPKAGLGTGLSDLHNQAPRTFLYLTERLLDEFGFNNMMGFKS